MYYKRLLWTSILSRNTFQEIMSKIFLNLGRDMVIQEQWSSTIPQNDLNQRDLYLDTLQSSSQKNNLKNQRILKAAREKRLTTYKGILIRLSADFFFFFLSADFLAETQQAFPGAQWRTQSTKNTSELPNTNIRSEGGIKTFPGK